jgi:hypothetical protein
LVVYIHWGVLHIHRILVLHKLVLVLRILLVLHRTLVLVLRILGLHSQVLVHHNQLLVRHNQVLARHMLEHRKLEQRKRRCILGHNQSCDDVLFQFLLVQTWLILISSVFSSFNVNFLCRK